MLVGLLTECNVTDSPLGVVRSCCRDDKSRGNQSVSGLGPFLGSQTTFNNSSEWNLGTLSGKVNTSIKIMSNYSNEKSTGDSLRVN